MATASKRKRKRTRNYALEYLIRTARGLDNGRSLAQARGHARAVDLPSNTAPRPFKRSEPLENALKLMKQGVSQREAAKQVGVSPETLRRFQKLNTTSHRKGRRWLIADTRPVSVVMATRGKMRTVTVSHDAASDISRHWIAINLFLDTNDASHLAAFVGKGLRDSKGVFHPFETRPNVLVKLDSAGELSFVDIYRQTAQQ
jgi:lambda repressor-like predicted transcriptional regulator